MGSLPGSSDGLRIEGIFFDLVKGNFSPSALFKQECFNPQIDQLSGRIRVLATAKTTMGPSVKLIEDKASEAGKQVTIHGVHNADVFDCFLRGDMETHGRIVKGAASGLTGKVGVVVLAQASMGHLAGAIEGVLKVPVLTSPRLAMDALVKKVKED